jgi:hypothetical protein
MTTIALVVAGLSLAGVVFLAFAYAASLKLIRELEDKLHAFALGDAPRQIDRFASDGVSFVVVGEEGCLACTERLGDLARYVAADGSAQLRFLVVQAGNGARPAVLPESVEFLADAGLVARLGIGVVPLGLVFDRSGTELARSVLGDAQAFERLAAWATEHSRRSVTEPQLAGRG